MTQATRAQETSTRLAPSRPRDRRSLGARRVDFLKQMEAARRAEEDMAISDLEAVGKRLKELRKRAGGPSQYEAAYEMGFKPRTFQSWENGEWETDRANYDRIATWYSEKLGRTITSNWILFGQDEEPPLPVGDPISEFSTADRLSRLEERLDGMEKLLREVREHQLADEQERIGDAEREDAAQPTPQRSRKRGASE